jgi:hypothetical protein
LLNGLHGQVQVTLVIRKRDESIHAALAISGSDHLVHGISLRSYSKQVAR